jgi:OOP family OmpA-OmpF porin
MNARKPNLLILSTCFTVASLGWAAGVQAADDGGWYLGAGIGQSRAGNMGNVGSTVDASLANQGVTGSTSFSGTNTAGKLFGGYQFSRYFGIEGGYSDLGQFSADSAISAPAPDSGSGTWKASNVWSLAAIGSVPIQKDFSAFGKLGLAYSKVDLSYIAPVSGATVSQSSSQTTPLLGLGLKYDIDKHIALRGEWERYLNLGDSGTTGRSDVNLWTVSVQYRF